MQNRFKTIWLIPILVVLGIGIFLLPPVYSRAMPRIDGWLSNIKYFINPPDEATFQPEQQSITATVPSAAAATQSASSTPAQPSTPIAGPTLAPKIVSTPLPAT